MSTTNGARVKLYRYTESKVWEELDTGYVTLQYVDRLQGLSILLRAELDGKYIIIILLYKANHYVPATNCIH